VQRSVGDTPISRIQVKKWDQRWIAIGQYQ
jgi:hypothetical protein